MALEETFIIRGPIDTLEVTRTFKEAGMPARITPTVALRSQFSVEGSVRDIKALLEEEIDLSEKLAEKTGIEDDEDTELRRIYGICLDVVEGLAETMGEFMEKNQPGTFLPMNEFKGWMGPPPGTVKDTDEPESLIDPLMYSILALTALDDNDVIDVGEGGVTVKQHLDPGSLIISLPGGLVGDIGNEARKEHGIVTKMAVIPASGYRLEFAPDVIAQTNVDELDELFDGLDIDEDVYLAFRESVYLKQIAISKIMEVIEEHGTLTPAEVLEAIEKVAIGSTEGGMEVTLDLTLEFVKDLLNDLKKMGLVRKKGMGFRMT